MQSENIYDNMGIFDLELVKGKCAVKYEARPIWVEYLNSVETDVKDICDI